MESRFLHYKKILFSNLSRWTCRAYFTFTIRDIVNFTLTRQWSEKTLFRSISNFKKISKIWKTRRFNVLKRPVDIHTPPTDGRTFDTRSFQRNVKALRHLRSFRAEGSFRGRFQVSGRPANRDIPFPRRCVLGRAQGLREHTLSIRRPKGRWMSVWSPTLPLTNPLVQERARSAITNGVPAGRPAFWPVEYRMTPHTARLIALVIVSSPVRAEADLVRDWPRRRRVWSTGCRRMYGATVSTTASARSSRLAKHPYLHRRNIVPQVLARLSSDDGRFVYFI